MVLAASGSARSQGGLRRWLDTDEGLTRNLARKALGYEDHYLELRFC